MNRPRIPRDMGLTLRMGLSMFLLAALYLAFMLVLARLGVGFLPIVVLSGGFLIVQYYFSDRMVLLATGAKIVSPSQEPELHSILEKLAALADLPMPKVAVMTTDVPNAFATGRDPRHAVIACTTGLMNRLTAPELEAVLAHEMTHVKHRDMTLITMASFFATIASTIVQMAFWFMPLGGFGGGNNQDEDGIIFVYLASLLVWIISFFLINALSRYREYAADRGSAILTGAPSQLASALTKISGTMSRIPNRDLRQSEALSALFIIPAVRRNSLMELFQTHPSLEHRLEQLRRIEQELDR